MLSSQPTGDLVDKAETGDEDVWDSAREGTCALSAIPLRPLPSDIFINVGRSNLYIDFSLSAEPIEDPYGEWPMSCSTSSKRLTANEGVFSFAEFTRSLHLHLGAAKSIGFSGCNGIDDAEDAYELIIQKYGRDLVLEPYLDFAIIDPHIYGEDILAILQDIHFMWADALKEPRPDPFPRAVETLDNGHLFLRFGTEL